MALELRYAARSDVGLVRQGNEDSGYASPRLLIVADGMGGHAAGELASATAVATIAALESLPLDAGDAVTALSESIDDIGDAIATVIQEDPELTGMGTTVTGVYWLGGQFVLAHVGDSRAYLLRDGSLVQLTHDHTYVQTLVDAGRLTEQQASTHPRRSLLMRAIDGMNPVESDVIAHVGHAGDRLMLCSDGLSGLVGADEIAGLLQIRDLPGCVTRLVDLAIERGAPDNVTVVVADIVDVPESTIPDANRYASPVVVGAAGEPRVRLRLPSVRFPIDAQPDPNRPDLPPLFLDGPPTAEQPLIDSEVIAPVSMQGRLQAASRRRARRHAGVAVATLSVIVLIGITGVLTARAWLAQQWYVGINGNPGTGTVAIYSGIPDPLIGMKLSTLQADSGLTVGGLPLLSQEMVSKTIPAADLQDAQRIVGELRTSAAACQVAVPPAGCPGAIGG
jgi:PPM family protein phosphatase